MGSRSTTLILQRISSSLVSGEVLSLRRDSWAICRAGNAKAWSHVIPVDGERNTSQSDPLLYTMLHVHHRHLTHPCFSGSRFSSGQHISSGEHQWHRFLLDRRWEAFPGSQAHTVDVSTMSVSGGRSMRTVTRPMLPDPVPPSHLFHRTNQLRHQSHLGERRHGIDVATRRVRTKVSEVGRILRVCSSF